LSSRLDFDTREGYFVNTKPIIHAGIALILLGIVAFTYQGDGDTSREKSVDIGAVQAAVDAKRSLAMMPVLGALVLVGGIVLVAVGVKRSS
jgi:uncharacterized membrane protein HdeD (DUF308 family)